MLLTAAFDSSFDKLRMLKSKNLLAINNLPNIFGGNGGIRTLDEALHPILPSQGSTFGHSVTFPIPLLCLIFEAISAKLQAAAWSSSNALCSVRTASSLRVKGSTGQWVGCWVGPGSKRRSGEAAAHIRVRREQRHGNGDRSSHHGGTHRHRLRPNHDNSFLHGRRVVS